MAGTNKGGGKTRAAFEGQTPARYKLAAGNPVILAQLAAIDTRAEFAKTRARAHFWRYEETWVVREALSLWNKRPAASMQELPAMAREYAQASIMTEARRNVRARMTNRLTKINSISTRMTNSVLRNLRAMNPDIARGPDLGRFSPQKGPKR